MGRTCILISAWGGDHSTWPCSCWAAGSALALSQSPGASRAVGFSDFLQVIYALTPSILLPIPSLLSSPPGLQLASASNHFPYSFIEFSSFSPKSPATI